jgi:leucyl/phenylalanyl-tRNA--protein transferase
MSIVKDDGSQTPGQEDLMRLSKPGEPLSPFIVMLSYSRGVFPWLFNQHNQQCWWSLEPRSIIETDKVHVSRSLRKTIRRGRYRITADTSFEKLTRLCVSTRGESWITDEMHEIFATLHHLGHMHSIETWEGDQLVGGLFGMCIGKMFSGVSMFSTSSDASKVALVALCRQLKAWDVPVVDCQVQNPFLRQMGAILVPRSNFVRGVQVLVRHERHVGPWTAYFK